MTKKIDVEGFAQRVERMCDFLLSKVDTEKSDDSRVVEDLKEEAADLQFHGSKSMGDTIDGLKDYMAGHPSPELAEQER